MPFKFNELAAALKERGLVRAELADPFSKRGERIGSGEQSIKPLERAIGGIEAAGEAFADALGLERDPRGVGEGRVSAAKVYDNLIYARSINVLA